ncbi:GDSL-type esterase/lipase family protein [Murimonas intestini]|uniref:GDSL-type esterase/lipase family protein n=1 Tax=Murimonas intestini TaxID=1337051 RepID=UPI0011DCE91D|nr:GDSL-type esterase/lipase family protein [Murimonas intestini]
MEKTIVCFGDSNTHGYKSEDGGRFTREERWPCLLEKYLGDGYYVTEEGLSGRTTVFEDPLFEGLNGMSSIFSCLMSHEPVDLLIIMLGTNDTKDRFHVNAENIGKGLERLVNKAISVKDAWRNRPNILIITPAPIGSGYEKTAVAGEMGTDCIEKSENLHIWFKDVAGRLGCHYLNAGEIDGISMHPNDYMHLDKDSHERLARRLADIIPEIV